jgi:hypothetical protein
MKTLNVTKLFQYRIRNQMMWIRSSSNESRFYTPYDWAENLNDQNRLTDHKVKCMGFQTDTKEGLKYAVLLFH